MAEDNKRDGLVFKQIVLTYGYDLLTLCNTSKAWTIRASIRQKELMCDGLQICGTVDLPQRHSHHVQQVGAIIFWLPLPSSLDLVAYVLLLCSSLHSSEAGLCGGHQYEQ